MSNKTNARVENEAPTGNLLFMAIGYSALFAVVIIAFGAMTLSLIDGNTSGLDASELSARIQTQRTVFWCLCALTILVVAVLARYFYRNVYVPVKFLQRSVGQMLDDGNVMPPHIDERNELHSTAAGIITIKGRMRELLESEYTAKLLKKQAELNALQSQINPHFLYNTLESIRSQAMIEGAMDIARMTQALASMFRYVISQKEGMATFAQELQNTENYLLIQQFRFYNKFLFIKDFSEQDEEIMECLMPRLTIQPIVENAIFHGLEPKSSVGTVKISIFVTQSRVVITIKDDGVGMTETRVREFNAAFNTSQEQIISAQNLDHKSLGLFNVNERIKLSYGRNYGLHIYSTLGAGTSVEISLPK